MTATKYSDMQQITANIAKGINQLNEKYRELQPYLEQIDQVHFNISSFHLIKKSHLVKCFFQTFAKLLDNF